MMDAPTCKECGGIACYVFSCANDPNHQGVHIPRGLEAPQPKKTLRDEFALAALQAVIADAPSERASYYAWRAYEIADSMLKERAK